MHTINFMFNKLINKIKLKKNFNCPGVLFRKNENSVEYKFVTMQV